MKKLLFAALLIAFTSYQTIAQVLPRLDKYNLETAEGAIDADSVALKVADFLFKTPLIRDDNSRLRAGVFLNKWMEATPTYTFMIDEDILDNFEGDFDLKDLYMAALTRFTLQNPNEKNEDKISVEAMKQVLAYANDDDNMVLLSKRMEKLIAANEKGKLEKAL
ncbi:hypothetical protein GCM10023149_10430 [Mucilaginibacter gynuensis]|uniref:Uncharacterized protein n=1 Tax=Mucilaginibacter gynuensis TaxID=1302236 RepID=A0ABP8G056_9SPHI